MSYPLSPKKINCRYCLFCFKNMLRWQHDRWCWKTSQCMCVFLEMGNDDEGAFLLRGGFNIRAWRTLDWCEPPWVYIKMSAQRFNVRIDGLKDHRSLPGLCFVTCSTGETMREVLHRLHRFWRYYSLVPKHDLAMIFGFALGRISTPVKRVLRDDMKIGDIGNHATHYLELTVIRFAPALIRGIQR